MVVEEEVPVRDVSRYVARFASDWGSENPRWWEIDGTLVFVDISGFTNLSERLTVFGRIGAEELTSVLDRVFASMLDLAYQRGGSLLKFGGDALLLLFTGVDHPSHACAAAVEMRAALRAANKMPTSVGRLQLNLSIGVHSGGVHLFRVGTSHTELLIAGPVASTTTEMEKTAQAGEIVISGETRVRVPGGAAEEPRGAGWLLGWRPPLLPPGPVMRRQTGAATDQLLPVALRRHLAEGATEPEHRLATIGFIRFSGLDAVLRDLGPEAGAQALDELITQVQAAVDDEGVTFLATDIDSDGGKVILATGVPDTHEDDEGRMLRAVRRIADSDLALTVQIGVNRGHVYSGEIGTLYRCAYTVMGDTVNLAARLMAAAGPREVYASPAALDGSRTVFAVRALEPLSVKGKTQPVQAYAVGAEVGTRHTELSTDVEFQGRADELAATRRALEADSDRARVVTIVGPPGVGKTRLADEALAAHAVGSRLSVRGEPYATAVPYRALRYPFRRLLGLEDAPFEDMATLLSEAIRALEPELEPYVPLIADVVHVEVPNTDEVDAIDPRFRSERLADAVEQLLAAALPRPAVLVVDDAQWLDDASVELLARLAINAAERGWSLAVMRRDQPGGFEPAGAITVSLGPLPAADSHALVNALTATAPLRPDDVAAIVNRAGGNPLYLQELVKAVRAVGGHDELPESLDGAVAVQIDRLAPLPRRILRFAAVLGRTFPSSVLDAVLAAEQLDADAAADAELADFLVRDGKRELRFRDALVQEVAYAGLSYARRRQLHALAGEAIERLNRRHPERAADVLGLHYQRAQRHAKAWHYGRIAADAAAQAYANSEAAVHYERALESARRLPEVSKRECADVWVHLGDVRERLGAFDLALDAYRRAARLVVGDAIHGASMSLKRARARERAGAYTAALAEITTGLRKLDAAPTADASLRARLLVFRAVVRQAQSRKAEALVVAEQAAVAAVAAGDDLALADAYRLMDWGHQELGQPEWDGMGERALRIYEALDHFEGQGKMMISLGVAAYYRDAWDEAQDWYERARVMFLRSGNHVQAAISTMNIGEILVNEHKHDEAEPMLRDAIRVFQASKFRDGQALAEIYLGRSLLDRGELEAAEQVLRRARQGFEAVGVASGALEASVHLADCRVQQGDPADALRLLDDAVERVDDETGVLTASVARVQAAALAAIGRSAESAARLAEGLDAARRQHLQHEERLLLDLRDQLGVHL